MVKLILSTTGGDRDITDLCKSINISGEYSNCARILTFGMAVAYADKNVPFVEFFTGSAVRLFYKDKVYFTGRVYSKDKSTDDTLMTVVAFDYGFSLKKIESSYKFTGQTPEQITQRLCGEYNIAVGSLAKTGVGIKRKFIGESLYSIIQSAYTLAGDKTGKKYIARFSGSGKLEIIEKGANPISVALENGANVISLDYSESIENMVNRVLVQNDNGTTIKSVSEDNSIKLYGLMQSVVVQKKGESAMAEAKKLLADKGLSQKIVVVNIGNADFITGGSVVLSEPYTGLKGLFWIDSDLHTFSGGSYTNKLTLNFKNIMHEQKGGSEK